MALENVDNVAAHFRDGADKLEAHLTLAHMRMLLDRNPEEFWQLLAPLLDHPSKIWTELSDEDLLGMKERLIAELRNRARRRIH